MVLIVIETAEIAPEPRIDAAVSMSLTGRTTRNEGRCQKECDASTSPESESGRHGAECNFSVRCLMLIIDAQLNTRSSFLICFVQHNLSLKSKTSKKEVCPCFSKRIKRFETLYMHVSLFVCTACLCFLTLPYFCA